MKFKLRFNKKAIHEWTENYSSDYDSNVESLVPQIRERGYLLKHEFETFCRWKTPRSQKLVASKSAEYVEAVTKTALSSTNEQFVWKCCCC